MTKQRIIEHLQSLIDSWKAGREKYGDYQLIFISETDVEALEEAKRIVKEATCDE